MGNGVSRKNSFEIYWPLNSPPGSCENDIQYARYYNPLLIIKRSWILTISDEFELEADLWRCWADHGHFNFLSWNRADVKKFFFAQFFFSCFFFTKIVTLFTLISVLFAAKSFSSKNEWFSGSDTGIFLKIQWKK